MFRHVRQSFRADEVGAGLRCLRTLDLHDGKLNRYRKVLGQRRECRRKTMVGQFTRMYATCQPEHLFPRGHELRFGVPDELQRVVVAGRSPRRTKLGSQATEAQLRPISETALQTAALRVSCQLCAKAAGVASRKALCGRTWL